MKIKNSKLKIALFALLFLLSGAKSADAGFLINRPLYIGLSDGLVGSWSFDGKDMNATQARDASGNANHGTLTNGPVRTEGKIGQALNFDAVNDSVQVSPAGSSLNITGPVTISAWIKSPAMTMTLGGSIAAKSPTNGSSFDYLFLVKASVLKWQVGATAISSTQTLSSNVWYHVVAVYNGSTLIFYVNGVSDSHAYTTNPTNLYTIFSVGSIANRADYYFNGLIDEVRVYNRALSAEEIKRLYNIGATLKVNKPLASGNLQQGLVGSWSFDAPDLAGVTAYDRSGNANNGTLTNGPARTIGRIGQALNFDGVDDYVNIADSSSLDLSNFALSMWIKPNATQVTWATIIAKGNTGVTKDYNFFCGYYNDLDTQIFCNIGNGTVNSGTGLNATLSTNWQLLTFTADGSTLSLFLNGVLVDSESQTIIPTNNNIAVMIAADLYAASTYNLNGLIDEVRVYNRALSADEIKRLYNMGATLKVNKPAYTDSLTTGLVGSWSFNAPDLAGVTAYDRSGQGNNGTLTNGPTRTIGRIGQALNFDGVDDIVRASTFSQTTFSQMSVSAWVYSNNYGKDYQGIVSDGAYRHRLELRMSSTTRKPQFVVSDSDITYLVTAPSALSNGSWYHITGTFDKSLSSENVKLFVNGVLQGTSNFTGNLVFLSSNLDIGTIQNSTSYIWNGLIDEVRIYNRALSPDEIKRLYNAGR